MIDANSRTTDRVTESAVRRWIDGQESARRGLIRCDVRVLRGEATLEGRVRSASVAQATARGTGRVLGVTGVVDRLVADDELEIGVAGAIARGALNGRSRLVVRSSFGRVQVGGIFASSEARAEAMRIGSQFPGVAELSELLSADLSS